MLEDAEVVGKGMPISAKAMLSAPKYWTPPLGEDSHWLYNEVFPSVRKFMTDHEGHRVIFGDQDDFLYGDAEDYYKDYFNWMQVGYASTPSIRLLVEQLHLKAWDEVCNYVRDRPPSWMCHDMIDAAKRKFEELVHSGTAS